MTSLFARYGCRLRQQTLDAYEKSRGSPRSVNERLNFYLLYLEDLVPERITVNHVPVDLDN